ncbi:Uncharacterised protein [Vibrio cholerae]|nr:Uncharacterised protein [Vibrio cholerae]CSI68251.1 Uncharacterised protein [Vibrio cholerae]
MQSLQRPRPFVGLLMSYRAQAHCPLRHRRGPFDWLPAQKWLLAVQIQTLR